MTQNRVKTYRSEIAAAVHQTVEDIHGAGLVSKRTMRDFDDSCLVPAPHLTPKINTRHPAA